MKRQRLGQHYLVDEAVVSNMLKSAEIGPGDRVLEIGTGRGALTGGLARQGRSFEAYEVDPVNYRATLEEVQGLEGKLHLGDAFSAEPRFDVLVSSLPYSESAGFVDWLAQRPFRRAVVLLQADFIDKVLSPAGTRGYRAVSAVSQISTQMRVVSKVGRAAFSPPPKVGSVIVVALPRRRMTGAQVSNVKRLFSLRRRTVASAARELGMVVPQGLRAERRVYALEPEEVWGFCRS